MYHMLLEKKSGCFPHQLLRRYLKPETAHHRSTQPSLDLHCCWSTAGSTKQNRDVEECRRYSRRCYLSTGWRIGSGILALSAFSQLKINMEIKKIQLWLMYYSGLIHLSYPAFKGPASRARRSVLVNFIYNFPVCIPPAVPSLLRID